MKALALREDRFLDVLRRLIALTPKLQNNPGAGLVPEERLAAQVVLDTLAPHIESGFIQAESVAGPGQASRPCLVLTVPGEGEGAIGFVGAHFDVVPADQKTEGWERSPFELWEGPGGVLYGRGVTDCLGHVAVLTDLLAQLAERKVRPSRTLKVVLISNEESSELPGLGLNYVAEQGMLKPLDGQPVYWLDSANFGPTLGTAGVSLWELKVTGVGGHSGMPQNCVNALELGMAASLELARFFHERFPPTEDEKRWGFLSSSSLKATVVEAPNTKETKVPADVVLRGDIRLTPFYDLAEVQKTVTDFMAELDARLERDDAPAHFPRTRTAGGKRGELAFRFQGEGTEGIACRLDSEGLRALKEAMQVVRGVSATPFSLTGSLPLVRDLQRQGCDVQITGFGDMQYYHAPNEQARLEDFRQGFAILRELLVRL
ncbi:peptidase homolog, M20 family [Myxococcus xanthus DK 1622]|uniref:Peptidase homolog, M20 family n=3 Tax=Myxococcus TaxID=32 RepID=Q1DFN7_MYXXD|nr:MULTISPECIES: M20/M25/M40 family metallo-hydrolase [Myxococcus]ABF85949.1 peptidase homolog, M20 family [Myxococcus xanthus DK 1622]NOJ56113.1 M20/M25/M40 family metallo-hydrolase [Myxococcus xanthus]QPM79979.1 M20/M25/M40 family metallo-hydrolase [Myxococcus xanthus]QVW69043.1 M20/M25/M40 family metallo-hydrolase [Myxococcus xanthus DZ2]QZZ47815.1 Acetylornithine deacetylase [Myxococcus xanthus]